jgi:hypothetical protein
MANELPNEQELYDEIKRSGISIDPRLWQILSHHIGNDVQVIHLSVKCLSEMPPWIMQGCKLMLCLHRKFKKGFETNDIDTVCAATLERANNITGLLDKLRTTVKYDMSCEAKKFARREPTIREL